MADKKKKKKQDIPYTETYAYLKDLRGFIPEPPPSRIFKVGDEVSIGSLRDCIVEEVLEGGKVYKIDYTHTNSNYGNPIITPHTKGYWNWLSLLPRFNREEDDKKPKFTKKKELWASVQQTNIEGLMSKYYNFGCDMNPDYQRDYVWTDEDRFELLESIFNDLEIGRFVFNDRDVKDKRPELYEIIDGKQRMITLMMFYEDRFTYKGLKYSEMKQTDRNQFDDFPVAIMVFQKLTKEEILKVFVQLNTTGKVMDKQHLNKVKNMLEKPE